MQRIQGLFRVLKIVIFSGVYSCGGFMRQATARLSPSNKTRYCFRIQHIALGIEDPFVSKGFVQSAAVFVFSFGTYQRLDFSVRPISIEPHPLFRLKPRPPHKNGRVLPGPYSPPRTFSLLRLSDQQQKNGRISQSDRSGSGRRTRTSDLRVMSPTSCQLLHPAICLRCVIYRFCKCKGNTNIRSLQIKFYAPRPPR